MDWYELVASIPKTATITISVYEGHGAHGPKHQTPVTVDSCVVEHKRRYVQVQTQDAAGAIVVSSTTVRCPPGTVAPVGSLVTVPGGSPAKVLQRAEWDDYGLGLPSHVELLLE